MSRPRFDEALDACIDDISTGRRTVAECLEQWPRFRAELEPLLEAAAALHRTPRLPESPPDPARRAQLMAALRETPQERPRRRPLRALAGILLTPWGTGAAPGRFTTVAAPAVVAAVAVLAAVLVTMVVLDRGASTAYASTLTIFGGTVEQQVDGAWQPLADGSELDEGVRLRTAPDGRALLTFMDGSTVGIEPGTELLIEITRLDQSRRIQLQQFSGRLWNDVAPDDRPDALYVVRTPDAVVSAHGTLFETVVADGQTDVTTTDGLVEVRAGDARVLVAPGEIASAQGHRTVTPVRPHDVVEGNTVVLTVNAPFAASLIAPDGRAVGVRPDGIVFRQIAGAATSHPDQGPQRIELQRPDDGAYELVLRRIGEGGGELILLVNGREHRIPVNTIADAGRLRFKLTTEDGRIVLTPERIAPVDATHPAQVERVVVTELARRRAVPIAARSAGTPPPERDARATPPAAVEPAAPRPDAGATGSSGGQAPDRPLRDIARARLLLRLCGDSPDPLQRLVDADTRNVVCARLATGEQGSAGGDGPPSTSTSTPTPAPTPAPTSTPTPTGVEHDDDRDDGPQRPRPSIVPPERD